MHSQLTFSPKGLTLAGHLLAKRAPNGAVVIDGHEAQIQALLIAAYGKPVSRHTINTIKRAGALLAEVQDDDWDSRTAHRADDVPVLAKAHILLAMTGLGSMEEENIPALTETLCKLDKGVPAYTLLETYLQKDDDSDEDEDDNDDDEDDSDYGDDEDGDNDDGDFNDKHPRWPAGSSDGTGGEFRSADSNVATDSDRGSLSADDIRSGIEDGMNDPSLPQGTQVAADTGVQSDASPNPASSMTISQDGLNFVMTREGYAPATYQDQAENNTIGYGHELTDGESYPNGITQQQALQLFTQDVATAETAVQNNVTVPLTQQQYDALVSLAYNIGGGAFANSTLVQQLNEGNITAAADQFLNWNKITTPQGTKVTDAGLTNRRNFEQNLFLNGNYR